MADGRKHSDPLLYMQEQRAKVLNELRSIVPSLISQLEAWDEAIAVLRRRAEPAVGEYSNVRWGADAMVAHLKKVGPQPRLGAIRAVVAGGWASEHSQPAALLYDAIVYQLGRAKNAKVIALPNDFIGLPEHKQSKHCK